MINLVRAAIRERGPVPFAWFMEQALYHPEHGYYSAGRCAIGRAGDYFTNVSVGPLFGRLLAAQFAEMWGALGWPKDFVIVEQGAHGGDFACDMLTTAQEQHSEFFAALCYRIIEPFPVLRERQAAALAAFDAKVHWRRSLEELPPFRGVHFSNELLDAFPVHLVRWTGAEWMERCVAEIGGRFAFADQPVSCDALARRLGVIPQPLPSGYETEVSLAAPRWIEALAPKLTEGFVMAVDYGWARDEFYAPHRIRGTLRCYSRHRVLASPLSEIGRADITAHVEWTTLIERAHARGLTLRGCTDQHHFITGLLAAQLDRVFSSDPKAQRALQTLLHPTQLGMKFKYLVFEKGAGRGAQLSGLSFARL